MATITVASSFTWMGMVLAISFMEAPLKFRAEGMTLQIGLSLGRLVFRALNVFEVVLSSIVGCSLVLLDGESHWGQAALWFAVLCLVVQLIAIRPQLTRRTEAVLAGITLPRSRAHRYYVMLEVLKVMALAVGGCGVLTGPLTA